MRLPRTILSVVFLGGLSGWWPLAALAGEATWERVTLPPDETIESLLFLPNGTLLAGKASASVSIISSSNPDSAESWGPYCDGIPAPTSVLDMAIDYVGSMVFAATNRGVFVSGIEPAPRGGVAGGEVAPAVWSRWASGPLDSLANAVVVLEAPLNPDVILVGTRNGLFRSSFTSPEWVSSSGGMSGSKLVNDLLQVGAMIVAAVGDGVYISTDGGFNWERRDTAVWTEVKVIAADTSSTPTVLFAGTKNGVFRSGDLGGHWTRVQVSGAPPGNFETWDVLVDGGYPGSVYAGIVNFDTTSAGVYQSHDGSTSWRGIKEALSLQARRFVKALAKSSPSSRVLFAGTSAGVWVTTLPTATSLTPQLGLPGSSMTLSGTLLGASQGSSIVLVTPDLTASVTSWSDTAVTFQVPADFDSGRVAVARSGGMTNGLVILFPQLILEDQDSGSRERTNEAEVLAIHHSRGAVDSIRVLSGDVVGWSLDSLDTWVAAADSSLITFQLPTFRSARPGEGPVWAYMEFKSEGGGTFRDSAEIYLDLAPPTVSRVVMRDLDGVDTLRTDSLWVDFIHDAGGADFIKLLSSSDLTVWSYGAPDEWLPYVGATRVMLAPGDGAKTMHLAFRDQAGNEVSASASIQLDTTPPVIGEVKLRDPETGNPDLTDGTLVRFVHTATEASSMRLAAGDPASWSAGTIGQWVAYADSSMLTLVAGDGVRTVHIVFADSVGNETGEGIASIEVDTTPPALPDPLYLADLDTGDQSVTDSTVVLFRHAVGSADFMRVMAGPGITGWSGGALDTWWPAALDSSFITLSSGDGLHWVAFEVMDRAGNSIGDSVEITLDTDGPSSMLVLARDLTSGSTLFTDSLQVRLVHRVAGANSMRLLASSDASLWDGGDPGVWVAAADSSLLTLTSGDGAKQIAMEFRDQAGNVLAVATSITLDTVLPEFFLAVHQNPILPAQLLLYASPSESLGTLPAFVANGSALTVEAVPAATPPLYRGHYTLSGVDTVDFVVSGADRAGNLGVGTLVVQAARAVPGKTTVLGDAPGYGLLFLPAGAVREEIFLVASCEEGDSGPITRFDPAGLSLGKQGEVRLRPSPALLGGAAARDLAVFQGSDAGWEELDSWIATVDGVDWLVARVDRLGSFRLGRGTRGPARAMPLAFRLAPNHPNPFNPQTMISFDLPASGAVSLVVFDVQGRERAQLLDGEELLAGEHEIVFRGRDEAGHPLPSGVYFYRLEWQGQRAVQKMMLLR